MNTTPSKDKGASNDLEAMLGEFTSAQQNKGRETQNSNKETLNNANRKGRMWLENSPVCTKIIDSDFNLQFMSSAGISALKIDKVEDYYGHPYPFSFFPQASIDNMKRCLTKVKESGETIVNEAPICDVFGNEVWYQAIISRVDHDDGTMDYIMVVSSEITQRKKAEEKLKLKNAEIIKQNEKYELLNSELKKLNIDLGKSKEKAEESEKLKSA
ncbi:MAG: PAS domain-containing protein, partial [Flavobacteriales bacterium]